MLLCDGVAENDAGAEHGFLAESEQVVVEFSRLMEATDVYSA